VGLRADECDAEDEGRQQADSPLGRPRTPARELDPGVPSHLLGSVPTGDERSM
jgi:hypothetical protein